jgi:hypothetical protein
MGLRGLFVCKPGRSWLDSHRLKRYVDVLSISSEIPLREWSPIPAVGILVRDDSLETGRETQKKGGTDLKKLRVETKCIDPLLTPQDNPGRQVLEMRTRRGLFGKKVGVRLLFPLTNISSHLSVSD